MTKLYKATIEKYGDLGSYDESIEETVFVGYSLNEVTLRKALKDACLAITPVWERQEERICSFIAGHVIPAHHTALKPEQVCDQKVWMAYTTNFEEVPLV